MDFLSFLSEHISPSPEVLEALMEAAVFEEHKKGTVLLREGEICRKLYFVQEGMLRFYFVNEEGKDITHWFMSEQQMIAELDSYFEKKPSDYYIETLEDSKLFTLTLDKLNYLLDTFPELERFGRLFITRMTIQLGERLKDFQFRSAQERYRSLLETHPDILQRASLGHIASFLGIAQQSLSRIRAQM